MKQITNHFHKDFKAEVLNILADLQKYIEGLREDFSKEI